MKKNRCSYNCLYDYSCTYMYTYTYTRYNYSDICMNTYFVVIKLFVYLYSIMQLQIFYDF